MARKHGSEQQAWLLKVEAESSHLYWQTQSRERERGKEGRKEKERRGEEERETGREGERELEVV